MPKTVILTIVFILQLLVTGASDAVLAENRWAMLVGISRYPQYGEYPSGDEWGEIHGGNDVALLSGVLQQKGFEASKIATLTNAEATASAVRQKLAWLSMVVQPGDMLYIHFSCHGQLVEDADGDEADGWDEALIPYDAQKTYRKGSYDGECHICDDELHHWLMSLRSKLGPTGMLYVVLDACHIGEAYMNEGFFRGTNQVFSPKGKKYIKADVVRQNRRSHRPIEPAAYLAPICMLEACRAYELNTEKRVGDTYFGSLSYYTAQVLSNESISPGSAWWKKVEHMLNTDAALINQHLVIESSL